MTEATKPTNCLKCRGCKAEQVYPMLGSRVLRVWTEPSEREGWAWVKAEREVGG